MSEPIVTWNLILCAVAFPTLGWFIKSCFIKDQQISEMKFTDVCKRIDTTQDNLEKAQTDLWDMVKHHEHKIDCDRADCSATETSGVIVRDSR